MARNARPSQTQRLLEYLRNHPEGITQQKAYDKFGIARLASRMAEIKKQGIPFDTDTVEVTNRYGEKCRVAKYILRKDADDNG